MIDPYPYLFAGILIGFTVVMAVSMLFVPPLVSGLFGLNRPSDVKLQPYECGMDPVGAARVRFSIKFYLVAMLFILFDIEALFFYPWATVIRWLGWFGIVQMGIFLAILTIGYIYVWRRGAFQWD
jgi:NADH-quinone oxidoreductase subunit A